MSHLVADKTRAEMTPPAWLKHGVEIANFVNERAKRDDIVAYVGEKAGQGNAACFCPSIAEIELNVEKAFVTNVDPDWVGNLNQRATLFDWPKAAGVLLHEASHARWTLFPLEVLAQVTKDYRSPRLAGVMEFLEETRIEALATRTWPQDTCFLRSSALGIVMDGVDLEKAKDGDPYEISRLMILTSGRVDARSLEPEDVEELEKIFADILGEDKLPEYRAIWREAQRIEDHERADKPLLELAKRWLELLPVAEEPELPQELEQLLAVLETILGDAADSAEIGAQEDASDQEEQERWQDEARSRSEAADEKRELEQVAQRVFSKGTADIPDTNTTSRVVKRRPPKGEEHAAAVVLAQELERARYRDRVRVENQSAIPPGRLQTREALQGLAEQEQGQVVTARPWKRVARKHVEDPELKIGVMVDISGSMNMAMTPMAVTAWILAEAGYRIQAQVAQVYYGNSAFPTLLPGQRMPEVIIRSATDGTERFTTAFKALAGKLDLLSSTGARILVICSDTCYTHTEGLALRRWTDRCVQAGVAVLVMTYDHSAIDFKGHHLNKKIQLLPDVYSPVTAAKAIGQAAIKALAAVQTGR